MNCWEVCKCPDETREKCPSYPSRGLDCWKVTGTKCEQGKFEKASLEEKVKHCRANCEFFKSYAHRF